MNKMQLFSHINDITGGYFAHKKIEKLHSDEGWLMFPEKTVSSIEEGKKAPYPNVYVIDHPRTFNLTDELLNPLAIGMTYGNIRAVQWFLTLAEIANTEQRVTIQALCKEFSGSTTYTSKKTKLANPLAKPDYKDSIPYATPEVSLLDLIDKVTAIRNTPTPEYISGKKVIWQVPVIDLLYYEGISCDSWDQFDAIFLKIWSAFMSCLEQQIGKKDIKNKNSAILTIVGKYKITKKRGKKDYALRYKNELKEKYGIDICPNCDTFPCNCALKKE